MYALSFAVSKTVFSSSKSNSAREEIATTSWSARSSGTADASGGRVAVDDDDAAGRVGEPHLQRCLIVVRAVERLRDVERRKLDDHHALRIPGAFERHDGAAARDEAAAMTRDAFSGHRPVCRITVR